MDFSKLMAAQIARTSNKASPSATSSAVPVKSTTSKYLKRSEVEAAREAAYLAEQAAIESQRIAKAEKKRKQEDDDADRAREREAKRMRLAEESKRRQQEEDDRIEKARRKRLGLPDLPTAEELAEKEENDTAVAEEQEDISEQELFAKLRDLKEPIQLFGETHTQRLRRYYRLINPVSAVTPVREEGYIAPNPSDPIPTTLLPVEEIDMLIPTTIPLATSRPGRLLLARQMTSWLTLIFRAWSTALSQRDPAIKATLSGQQATNSYSQALSHLTPLYRKLEKLPSTPSELPDDLLGPICKLIRLAQERRYVDANDEYLQVSIGKAAWPIGVTMVGIHERSAREKIGEQGKEKAHIMSDESTRKMLQSIKRCLSFAQTRWPPEDVGQLMG